MQNSLQSIISQLKVRAPGARREPECEAAWCSQDASHFDQELGEFRCDQHRRLWNTGNQWKQQKGAGK